MNSSEFYSNQIKRLFKEYVGVEKYCFQDCSIEKGIYGDIILIPSYSLLEVVKKYVKTECEIIIITRTLTKNGFKKIMELSENTNAALVNVTAEMSVETISLIYRLGAQHVNLIPVYPEMGQVPNVDLAITPGESKYVPDNVDKIIDIGSRVLDIDTIVGIASKLGLENILENSDIKNYFKEIVPSSLGIGKILNNAFRLESQLDVLLEIFDDGIIAINSDGIIYSYNESAEKILGYKKEEILGNNGISLFPEIPFSEVLDSGISKKEELIKISDFDIISTITPIINLGIIYGAVAIIRKFSDTEKKQHKLRAQLIGKGHKAKYNFEDIRGESKSIKNAKNIAKRMAKSDSSILIVGETGTGKELFAQSIHNYSSRKENQFVAVNCAALPESLLESELFGYEEGAFTGARKGGKPGLFELAHRGTLFLDEIGDMPLKLQARLLRVLEEKEVMRIGGDSILNVDVRVIAATNKDLKELVDRRKFRQDLYFRLNVLPIKVPALRDRRVDIPLLIEEMKRDFGVNFKISPEVVQMFINYNWEGNIRELRNYIEYLANLGEEYIEVHHLPFELDGTELEDELQYELSDCEYDVVEKFTNSIERDLNEYIFILSELERNYHERKQSGRRSLENAAKKKKIFLTQYEIRTILLELREFNMVDISRGRGGTKITDLGLKTLEHLKGLNGRKT